MNNRVDKLRELELLLDFYLIFDKESSRYFIQHRRYHEEFVPRLRNLVNELMHQVSDLESEVDELYQEYVETRDYRI